MQCEQDAAAAVERTSELMIATISSGRGDLGCAFINSTIAFAACSMPLLAEVAECKDVMTISVLQALP